VSDDPVAEKTNFTSKLQYDEFVDEVIALARHELRIFENQLGTSYNASARHEALRQFLLASRRNRVRIAVHDATTIDRFCPRMQQLVRAFSHAVTIHETQQQAKGVYDPFVVADDMHSVRLFHFDTLRGLHAKNDPIEASALVERFEEIWEVSTPAVTANTLGL
jgi:hypothetical protein